MKQLILTIIILFSIHNSIFSQEILISEYMNKKSGGGVIKPDGEWVELIVIKDKLNLVNWQIRDNAGSGTWQSAYIFNDINLWKDIRIGTIIVIYNTKAPILDIDKSDGFICVGAENTTYFNLSSGSHTKALNLTETRDMIQISKPDATPCHTLGHCKPTEKDAFDATSGNKIAYEGSFTAEQSLAVIPGRGISEYCKGYDTQHKWTKLCLGDEITEGKPNSPQAEQFWRQLREPIWSNPDFTNIDIIKNNKIILKWNPVDNIDIDINQGYLLLRIKNSTNPTDSKNFPQDGKTYQKGDKIGKTIVVTNIDKLTSASYTDTETLECDINYHYLLFSYRYGDENDNSARGRAYNQQDYAISNRINIPKAGTPKIMSKNGNNILCSNDTLNLYFEIKYDGLSQCKYYWEKDYVIIPEENSNELKVTKSGEYIAYAVNELGCVSVSQIFTVIGEDIVAPILKDADNLIYQNDSTLTLCKNDDFTLIINGTYDSYQWYKDKQKIIGANNYIQTITESGEYYAEVQKGNCTAYTPKINFIFREIKFKLNRDTILLKKYNIAVFDTIMLTNQSEFDLLFEVTDILLPEGFSIVSPLPPYKILKKSSTDFIIKFDINKVQTIIGNIIFNAPCQNTQKIYCEGVNVDLDATYPISELTNIDFGKIPYCSIADTTFNIYLQGNDKCMLNSVANNLDGFDVFFTPNLPHIFNNDTVKVKIAFTSTGIKKYTENLIINFEVDGQKSKTVLELKISGEKYLPKLLLEDNSKYFIKQLENCKNGIDTLLTLSNMSDDTLKIKSNPYGGLIIFESLPAIIPPKETISIPVFIKVGKGKTVINYFPCNLKTDIIEINIQSNYYDFTLLNMETDTIDFTTIYNCTKARDSIINFDYSVLGDILTITDIILPQAYVIDGLSIGQELRGTCQFKLIFKSIGDGNCDGDLVIKFKECDLIKTFPILGTRKTPIPPKVSLNKIDFGQVLVGNSSNIAFTITNDDDIPIVVSSIINLNPPFFLIGDVPHAIPPNESYTYYIKYEPTEINIEDKNNIIISMTGHCDYKETIITKGIAFANIIESKVSISFPQNTILNIGQQENLPINIITKDAISLADMNIHNINISLKYNKNLLHINEVIVADAIISSYTDILFENKEQDELNLSFNIAPPYKIEDGEILNINVLPLKSNISEDNIIITKAILSSETHKINVQIEDGNIKLIGQCDEDNKQILLRENRESIEINKTIIKNNLLFSINIWTNDKVEVSLYNSYGTKVKTLSEANRNTGNYQYNINTSDLPSGLYLLYYRNANILQIKKIIKIN